MNKKIIIQFLFKVFKLDLTPWKFPLQAGTCIIFCLIYVSFRPSESFIMNYLKKQYFQHCLKFIKGQVTQSQKHWPTSWIVSGIQFLQNCPYYSHLFHSYCWITELIRRVTSICISEASEIGNLRCDVIADTLPIRCIFQP